MSFFSFIRDQYTSLPVPQAPDGIQDKTFVVTGANTGLGYECVKHLLSMDVGRVILGVRSLEKGETALKTIRQTVQTKTVAEVWELDLTSYESVVAFGHKLEAQSRIDGVILNAGVSMPRFEPIQGLETSLVVNVISTMLLALHALPKLQESAKSSGSYTNLTIVSSNTALEPGIKGTFQNIGPTEDIFDGLSKPNQFASLKQ